ncbi:MAG TPA: thymidine phosphorylase [Pyrinomonadaceae bacterium]|nr:thymidine phosphorylase [Pyrinomonadaceae bacterium]
MRPQDVIRKKRDGHELSRDEIVFFIEGVTRGTIADYQISALLMAVYLNGMNDAEQEILTDAMLHSGNTLDFSDIAKPKADKHSTGGVGDKTSLLIAPMVAACGICVPMISGRGLGHTGGTLDKLESIPGYRVDLSAEDFERVLKTVGYAMSGQTAELAPADKKMYALRDATSTVEAIPLIVASIISKKGAAGLDAMVIDVKVGSGAFMREEERALALAHALVKTGNACGIRTRALLTDMNQPLGQAVGNSLEVKECIELLRGEGTEYAQPVLDLSLELSAHMLVLSNVDDSLEAARERLQKTLTSGQALECFRQNVSAQGGEPRVCDDPASFLPLVAESFKVESPRSGFVNKVNTAEIGHAIASIGGGRVRIDDLIDPTVGFIAEARIGDRVGGDAAIGVVYCRDEAKAREAAQRIQSAYEISDSPPSDVPVLMKEVINE